MRASFTFPAAVVAAAALLAAPAVASVDPGIAVSPKRLTLGATATITGSSWVVGAGCEPFVHLRVKGAGYDRSIGKVRVPRYTAAIDLTFTPTAARFPAGTATIVATQHCPDDQGGDYVRTAKLTLVK